MIRGPSIGPRESVHGSSRIARALGLARSLAIDYGNPLRARRLNGLYAPFLGPGALAFDLGAHVGNRVPAFVRLAARPELEALDLQPPISPPPRELREVHVISRAKGFEGGSKEPL